MAHLTDSKAEEFLYKVKIKEITTTRNVITLNADDSISKAMQTLAQQGITAAPVYDMAKKDFIGFVDVLDLTIFIVYVFQENYQKHPHLYDPKELKQRFAMPIREVINASKRDPFWTVNANETVEFLISNFLKMGIHRVPVSDNGQIIGIVSQSDVVRLLHRSNQYLTATTTKTIQELGLDTGIAYSVRNDATLIEAFNAIIANNVTGIAIVNFSNGEIINNLSASDLKGITEASFFRLEAQLHTIFAGSPKMPPVTCTSNTKLQDVLSMIEKTGVHRVYVVDEQNRPKSVITLTDILTLFSRPGNPLDI